MISEEKKERKTVDQSELPGDYDGSSYESSSSSSLGTVDSEYEEFVE